MTETGLAIEAEHTCNQALEPLELAALSPEEVSASNALAQNRPPFALHQGTAKLTCALCTPPAVETTALWVVLSLGGDAAAVQLPSQIIDQIAGEPVSGGNGGDVALLIEDALAPWLDHLERQGWPEIALKDVVRGRPELPLRFGFSAQGEGEAGFAREMPLDLSAGAAARLAQLLPTSEALDLARYPVDLSISIELACLELPKSDFRRLKPGDGVRLPIDGPLIAKLADRLTAPVAPAPGGFELLAAFGLPLTRKGATPMDDAQYPAQDVADAEPLQLSEPLAETAKDAPVSLSFHAGTAQISVRDLASLAPGAVLPTHETASAAVEIRANGKMIGEGELMTLGSERVVRVTRLT